MRSSFPLSATGAAAGFVGEFGAWVRAGSLLPTTKAQAIANPATRCKEIRDMTTLPVWCDASGVADQTGKVIHRKSLVPNQAFDLAAWYARKPAAATSTYVPGANRHRLPH